MDACKALLDRLIEEGDLPASHHSVNLLKCNDGLGIRTDSGDVSCPIYPLNATEGLDGASLRSFRCHDACALKQSPLRRICSDKILGFGLKSAILPLIQVKSA